MKNGWDWDLSNATKYSGPLQTAQVFIASAALTAAGLLTLGLGAHALWLGESNTGLAQLGAGLVLLFASTIHRFELLKGLGMEARTKELKQTIDHAEDALAKLHQFIGLAGSQLLELRYNHLPPNASSAEGYADAMKIKEMLVNAGLDEATVLTALKPWIRQAAFELYISRLTKVRERVMHFRTQRDAENIDLAPEDMRVYREKVADETAQFDTVWILLAGHERWDIDQLQLGLKNLCKGIATLPAAGQNDLTAELELAIDQLSALVATGDFKNKLFWARLP